MVYCAIVELYKGLKMKLDDGDGNDNDWKDS